MAKAAYVECFSGVSGNMILGALLDAGLALETLQEELRKLPVSGFEIQTKRVEKQGLSALHVEVVTEETHVHRHLHHIREILAQSSLAQQVKDDSQRVFTRLAEAEAAVHNTTVERIHFHEVGALDAIVDIVGAVIGLRQLGIETLYVSPFALGTGFTMCAHGKIPVPVPATVKLLEGKPVRYTEIEAELVTPTGAAILSTLGDHFGPPPAMLLGSVGYGAGTRDLDQPNVVRLQVGQVADHAQGYETDTVVVMEANIDDMSPQLYDHLFERLYGIGALEVYTVPVMMKKTRPANLLVVLGLPEHREQLIGVIVKETTTIGVRWREMPRMKAQREIRVVETGFGRVRVKISRLGEEIIQVTPEYDDCKALVQSYPTVPLKRIYFEALEKGRSLVGW
ncbi:nickel pincer cofactor biosynthesis protein LarC [candidate division KSB3 bacterium]|nr:nickel pincer cofactor biosynthesis protein LarC [candidate division KSB3 bacterium]